MGIAAITEQEGFSAEAGRLAREVTTWLDGNGEGPVDLSIRASTILRAHRWLEPVDRVV